MAIKFPDKIGCKDKGCSGLVTCPSCGKEVEMKLFNSTDKSMLVKLLKKNETFNFAVCPLCCEVFEVKDEYVQAKDEGVTVTPTPDDFSPVERS